MKDFGIIVAYYRKDYNFAKGCCASIRYFLGNIPICLIVDGTFSVRELEKTYGVCALYRDNVTNHVLRERSFGLGLPKMVSFWESPWENFLYLDADTVVWGDFLNLQSANFNDFDLILDKTDYYSEENTCRWMFDTKRINKYFPEFRWQNRLYACTGVFFGKRGIFDLEEYVKLLDLQASEPTLFFRGEQGFFNFMIFRAADEGRIRLGQEHMQLVVSDFSQDELKKRLPMDETGPICGKDWATVVHYAGPKPTVYNSEIYAEPMQFFRRKFLRDARGSAGLTAKISLMIEDFPLYPKRKLLRSIFTMK